MYRTVLEARESRLRAASGESLLPDANSEKTQGFHSMGLRTVGKPHRCDFYHRLSLQLTH